MSIINEALKKTEQHLQMIATKEAQQPDKKTEPNKILLYSVILFCGIFLTHFIFSFLNQKVKTSVSKNKITPLIKPVPEVIPPPSPATPPVTHVEEPKPVEVNFVLNGIFYSDNDGYALVNNQIVREFDAVDGAKVNKITQNSVELDNQGTLITLTTQR